MKHVYQFCIGAGICAIVLTGCSSPKAIPFVDIPTRSSANEVVSPKDPIKPETKPLFYKYLELEKPVFKGRVIKVHGKSDLPDGSGVTVSIEVAGQKDSDIYLGIDKTAIVKDSAFSANLTIPNRAAYTSGNHVVKAMFTPRGQSERVLNLVGKNGERLKGNHVEKVFNFKTLQVSMSVHHKFEIKTETYHMVKPSDFEKGTAKRSLAGFLVCWKKQNWEDMAKQCDDEWLSSHQDPVGWLHDLFGFKTLLEAKFNDVRSSNGSSKMISVIIRYSIGSEAGALGYQVKTKELQARMTQESSGNGAVWKVDPQSISTN